MPSTLSYNYRIYLLRKECHDLFDQLYPTKTSKEQGYRDMAYFLKLEEPFNHFSRMGKGRLLQARRWLKKCIIKKYGFCIMG